MKLQLGAFIRRADASYEFVFLDGEHECQRAKGIGEFYIGPTLCFQQSVRPCDVQSSLDYLESFITEHGPFDGIIGFSQGASLALTYLLQESAIASSDSNCTKRDCGVQYYAIKWAVFISAIPAFSPDPTFYEDLFSDLTDGDRAILSHFPYDSKNIDFEALSGPAARATALESLAKVFDVCLSTNMTDPKTDHGFQYLTENAAIAGSQSISRVEGDVPRIMHPELLPARTRIRIATVHVVGLKDQQDLIESSRLMERVCEPSLSKSLAHGGGHEVPRSVKDVRSLWRAVDWAIRHSMYEV